MDNTTIDTAPFNISYLHHGNLITAEIHPCCNENNVVDYAVWIEGKLVFTIARDINDASHWAIAMKNADDDFEEDMIQDIGTQIEKRNNLN